MDRFYIDYPEQFDRLTTVLRLIWIIPIAIILGLLTATGNETVVTETGERVQRSGGGIVYGLVLATMPMIVFQMRYPRWWFNFARELRRFSARVGAYLVLVTDRYPSTVDEQSVHLEIDYPDVERDLNRLLPLVKWLLAIPHYIVLFSLGVAAFVAVIIAWFAILFTGRYPRGLFDFVVGLAAGGCVLMRTHSYSSNRPLPALHAQVSRSRTTEPDIAYAHLAVSNSAALAQFLIAIHSTRDISVMHRPTSACVSESRRHASHNFLASHATTSGSALNGTASEGQL